MRDRKILDRYLTAPFPGAELFVAVHDLDVSSDGFFV
jgi:hypothetical protein